MSKAWQLETLGRVVRLTLTRPPINGVGARDWEEGVEALLAKRTPDFEEA